MILCTHTKYDGSRCASPAVTGSNLCFFHKRSLQRVAQAATDELPLELPDLTDPASILAALSVVTQAIASHQIAPKRGALLLRSLALATRLLQTIAKAAQKPAEPVTATAKPAAEPIAATPEPATRPASTPPPPIAAHLHPNNRLPRSLRDRVAERKPSFQQATI